MEFRTWGPRCGAHELLKVDYIGVQGIGDYTGDYYRGYKVDARTLDYGSYQSIRDRKNGSHYRGCF